MKNNITRIFTLLSIFFIVLLLTACNEDPTSLGMTFLTDTVTITSVSGENEIYTGNNSYIIPNPVNNTGAILVGEALNMRAASFLRFDFPPNLGWIKEEDIVSAQLIIYPLHYALGDTLSSNFLSFDIKKITKRWTFEETTVADVFESDKLYDPEPLTSWSGNIVYKSDETRDTLDSIAIDIPKSLCVDWFQKRNTTPTEETPDDQITWGLALLPKAGCTVINQFRSAGDKYKEGSLMQVVYKKTLENGQDTNITLNVFAGVSTKFIDINEKIDENKIIAQGAVKIHSKLNFDISKIPDLAAVHFAEITLTLDTSQSYFGNELQDSVLMMGVYADPEKEHKNTGMDLFCYGRRLQGTDKFIFRSAEPMFMYLLGLEDKKGSLVLMQNGHIKDANSLNRFVFYNSEAEDENLRPKIKLIYSYLAPSAK